MSNVSQFHSKERIQEQACLWISRMDRGLSIAEKQELTSWINQNNTHHKILLEMASYWDDLSVLNELSALFPLEQTPLKNKNKSFLLAMAASVAMFTLISTQIINTNFFTLFGNQQHLVQQQIFKTKLGEQASFSMTDGTNIQLNTNTIITVAYTQDHRQITLIKGEARFNVAKDKTRPFTVIAGMQSFTALGTIFNVQKNNELAMELVVTEGQVLITQATESLKNITKAFKNPLAEQFSGTLVVSGEKAIISEASSTPVNKISLDQIQRELAWQQGILIFDGESLEQVLQEVGRYTATQFNIVDPSLNQLKVAGYFKAGDIEGLLASLSNNFNIDIRRTTDNTIQLFSANL